ncbi:MAG: SAM hydrolase/SAM-dependent halogenase family protein [Acidimicrobiales bacterium]
MAQRYDTISFLSDYGRVDEFVGVVHSVVRSIAPDVRVLDLTHEIAPHDVRAGGLALARSAQYLAAGIVLAVVDPGVGTERRAVAIEVGGGQSVLIGPDNGLLAPAVSLCGGADRALVLDNAEYHLASPGPTFAGRDIFAPAAAHLCNGVALSELGTLVDPITLLPGVLPISRPLEEGDGLVTEVLWVDRYGNCQLNVDPDELEGWGERVAMLIGDRTRTGLLAPSYAAVRVGEIGLVVDSYGLLSVVVDRGSASAELGLRAGDQITLQRLDDDDRAGITTSVELRARPQR